MEKIIIENCDKEVAEKFNTLKKVLQKDYGDMPISDADVLAYLIGCYERYARLITSTNADIDYLNSLLNKEDR